MARYIDSARKGYFELNPFPGCNQLVVSNHAFILKHERGVGWGKRQHHERLNLARDLGYDAVICTVKEGNQTEKAILIKAGWQFANRFYNKETEHNVEIWIKIITNARTQDPSGGDSGP